MLDWHRRVILEELSELAVIGSRGDFGLHARGGLFGEFVRLVGEFTEDALDDGVIAGAVVDAQRGLELLHGFEDLGKSEFGVAISVVFREKRLEIR